MDLTRTVQSQIYAALREDILIRDKSIHQMTRLDT